MSDFDLQGLVQVGISTDRPAHKNIIREAVGEITLLRVEVERLRGRCAELESGLEGIANCAYGYNHPKAQTADEAASWMNGEAMRLLGDPQPSAWLLRKQAEAFEVEAQRVRENSAGNCDPLYSTCLEDSAQRLRQQAAEIEKAANAGSNHGEPSQ